jgi:hypothetical protein
MRREETGRWIPLKKGCDTRSLKARNTIMALVLGLVKKPERQQSHRQRRRGTVPAKKFYPAFPSRRMRV